MATEFTKEAFAAGVVATTCSVPPSSLGVVEAINGAPSSFDGVGGIASGVASTSRVHASSSGNRAGGPRTGSHSPGRASTAAAATAGRGPASNGGVQASGPQKENGVGPSYVDVAGSRKKPQAADWSSMVGNSSIPYHQPTVKNGKVSVTLPQTFVRRLQNYGRTV